MIKQAIRLFGKQGSVIGQVVAIDRNKISYSAIHPCDEFDNEIAMRIATGRAMKRPITLEDFKEKATNYLTTEYIEYCETELLRKLYQVKGENSPHTVRGIINEDIIYNSNRVEMMIDRCPGSHKLYGFDTKDGEFRMTQAEIIYPYLVVMKDRMDRYFAKMTADEFDAYLKKLEEEAKAAAEASVPAEK